MRTEEYLPLVDHLHCSLSKSNPSLEFAVMVTRSISSRLASKIEDMHRTTLIYVDDLQYQNTYEERFRYNWLKIRAFELTQYDAVLLVDADTVIVGNVSDLFFLPTRFAATADQMNTVQEWKYPSPSRMLQAGVIMLRPCIAIAEHMIRLLDEDPMLRFSTSNAEQEFLSWYFRHEALMLPEKFNMLPSSLGNHDVDDPVIVHFTSNKPFFAFKEDSGVDPAYRYLCSRQEMRPS